MPDLVVNSLTLTGGSDCSIAIEFCGAQHQLDARGVGREPFAHVQAFEPARLFRDLPMSPFQLRELVRIAVDSCSGLTPRFPIHIPERHNP